MPLFTSTREKFLWIWALVVFVAIFSTLFIGQPLARLFNDQDVRAVVFLLVMVLVGVTIITHSLRTKPSTGELVTLLGIVAVYTMFFLRLGMPERSHLMEYSVLAIFIHKALLERARQGAKVPVPALLAFLSTLTIGIFDELIQIFLPSRVFDPVDILFNGLAALTAIGASMVLGYIRVRIKSDTQNKPYKENHGAKGRMQLPGSNKNKNGHRTTSP